MNNETSIHERERSPFAKHLRTRMISGLLVLIPVAITLFFLNIILASLTSFVRPVLHPFLGEIPEYAITLIALLVTTLIIYFTGLVTNYVIGRRMIRFGERLLLKMPIIKSIYSASKQAVDTFSSTTKAAFKAVVIIQFPRPGSCAIGFITGEMKNHKDERVFRVFVATTPNPATGFLLILPPEEVQFTDISIEDGIKMIVSGGVLSPDAYALRPPPPQLSM